MSFRQSGQGNDRRRRLLADESASRGWRAAPSRPRSAKANEPPAGASDNYGDAQFMDEQLRLIDLVPKRLSVFGLWLLGGLLVVTGLEALHASMPGLAPYTSEDGSVAAFDLDGEGSLAVWFSSVTLLLASLTAVLVYTIRRHRKDDYQGRYRVWLWAAMCWFIMSVDETSSLHEGFKEMMKLITGTSLSGDGSLWWVIPYFFLLGAVGSRLLVDMWESRLSSAALLTTAGCYGLAVVAQLGWIGETALARVIMIEEGAEMIGNLFLLLAMALHARFVILDAEGLLPRRKKKSVEDFEEEEYEDEYEEEPSIDEWLKIDAAHDVPPPSRKRKPARKKTVSASPISRKLTKQERKALRKKMLREKLNREREDHNRWGG